MTSSSPDPPFLSRITHSCNVGGAPVYFLVAVAVTFPPLLHVRDAANLWHGHYKPGGAMLIAVDVVTMLTWLVLAAFNVGVFLKRRGHITNGRGTWQNWGTGARHTWLGQYTHPHECRTPPFLDPIFLNATAADEDWRSMSALATFFGRGVLFPCAGIALLLAAIILAPIWQPLMFVAECFGSNMRWCRRCVQLKAKERNFGICWCGVDGCEAASHYCENHDGLSPVVKRQYDSSGRCGSDDNTATSSSSSSSTASASATSSSWLEVKHTGNLLDDDDSEATMYRMKGDPTLKPLPSHIRRSSGGNGPSGNGSPTLPAGQVLQAQWLHSAAFASIVSHHPVFTGLLLQCCLHSVPRLVLAVLCPAVPIIITESRTSEEVVSADQHSGNYSSSSPSPASLASLHHRAAREGNLDAAIVVFLATLGTLATLMLHRRSRSLPVGAGMRWRVVAGLFLLFAVDVAVKAMVALHQAGGEEELPSIEKTPMALAKETTTGSRMAQAFLPVTMLNTTSCGGGQSSTAAILGLLTRVQFWSFFGALLWANAFWIGHALNGAFNIGQRLRQSNKEFYDWLDIFQSALFAFASILIITAMAQNFFMLVPITNILLLLFIMCVGGPCSTPGFSEGFGRWIDFVCAPQIELLQLKKSRGINAFNPETEKKVDRQARFLQRESRHRYRYLLQMTAEHYLCDPSQLGMMLNQYTNNSLAQTIVYPKDRRIVARTLIHLEEARQLLENDGQLDTPSDEARFIADVNAEPPRPAEVEAALEEENVDDPFNADSVLMPWDAYSFTDLNRNVKTAVAKRQHILSSSSTAALPHPPRRRRPFGPFTLFRELLAAPARLEDLLYYVYGRPYSSDGGPKTKKNKLRNRAYLFAVIVGPALLAVVALVVSSLALLVATCWITLSEGLRSNNNNSSGESSSSSFFCIALPCFTIAAVAFLATAREVHLSLYYTAALFIDIFSMTPLQHVPLLCARDNVHSKNSSGVSASSLPVHLLEEFIQRYFYPSPMGVLVDTGGGDDEDEEESEENISRLQQLLLHGGGGSEEDGSLLSYLPPHSAGVIPAALLPGDVSAIVARFMQRGDITYDYSSSSSSGCSVKAETKSGLCGVDVDDERSNNNRLSSQQQGTNSSYKFPRSGRAV